MKVAALDLGSNTFLCLICEVEDDKIVQIYHDEVQVVRLGQGFGKETNIESKQKQFHPEALARADACLKKFEQTISLFKPEKTLAMATSAARDAENKEALFQLGQKHYIPIEIIPGHLEAQITYQGATSGLKNFEQILVVDIGGGSTEFVLGTETQIQFAESLDIGCVRLTEKFIHQQPTPQQQVDQATAYIKKNLEQLKSKITNLDRFEILAVAGTPTSIVTAEIGQFDAEKIDGYRLNKTQLINWRQKLLKSSVPEKIKMGIPAGRADVILIGVLILLEALNTFNKDELIVSTRGVRHGVALEMGRRFNS